MKNINGKKSTLEIADDAKVRNFMACLFTIIELRKYLLVERSNFYTRSCNVICLLRV